MKRQYFLVILVLTLLVFTASCDKDDPVNTVGTFKGGVAGVEVTFVEGKPPTTFDQGENVEFKVQLVNNGEFTIPAGEAKAQVYGTSPSFGLSNNYVGTDNVLYGVSKNVDTPGEQVVTLGTGNYREQIVTEQDFPVNARICYPYETKVSTTVCMGSRRIGESGTEQVCTVQGSRVTSGTVSAAPVQVTAIEESYKGSDAMRFSIDIENKGTGNVYDHAKTCETLDLQNDENVVYLEIFPSDINCIFPEGSEGPTGKVTLYGGSKTIVCERNLEPTANSNYNDNLRITLKYKYLDDVSKTVTVYEV